MYLSKCKKNMHNNIWPPNDSVNIFFANIVCKYRHRSAILSSLLVLTFYCLKYIRQSIVVIIDETLSTHKSI